MNIAVFASHSGSDLQAIIDGCKNDKINASDYHHSVHTFWKKNQKADAACIRRNQTNKGSKSGI